MKNILFVITLFACLSLVSSCYAYLQADRLIYLGTLGKDKVNHNLIDTINYGFK